MMHGSDGPAAPADSSAPVPFATLAELLSRSCETLPIVLVPHGAPTDFLCDWTSDVLKWPPLARPLPDAQARHVFQVPNVGDMVILQRYCIRAQYLYDVVALVEDCDWVQVVAYPNGLSPIFEAQASAIAVGSATYNLAAARVAFGPPPHVLPSTTKVIRTAEVLRSLHSCSADLSPFNDEALAFVYSSMACDQPGEVSALAIATWYETFASRIRDVANVAALNASLCQSCGRMPCILLRCDAGMSTFGLNALLERATYSKKPIVQDKASANEQRHLVYRQFSGTQLRQVRACVVVAARLLYSGGAADQAVGFRSRAARS